MAFNHSAEQLLDAIFECIEKDIVPKTRRAVEVGCKVFGAAILRKSDLSLVLAETNNEARWPLFHGEVHCIFCYNDLQDKPPPKDCIFVTTHEPCSLCLSAITWSGFDNFFYLFSYEDTRDSFAIPYDIQILEAVYKVQGKESQEDFDRRPLYNKENAFFKSKSVADLVATLPIEKQEQFRARKQVLSEEYATLSKVYQASKGAAGIPLA